MKSISNCLRHCSNHLLAVSFLAASVFATGCNRTLSPMFPPFGQSHSNHNCDLIAAVVHTEVGLLSERYPGTKRIGGGGSWSGSGESKQHRTIHCSSDITLEMMRDIRAWLELFAGEIGIKLQGDGGGGSISKCYANYRYVYGPRTGTITLSIESEKKTRSKEMAAAIDGDTDYFEIEVVWEIKETEK